MIFGLPMRLVRMRSRMGWTQAELASLLGVNQATVSRWESGLGAPRAAAMVRIEGLEHEDDRHGQRRVPEYADSIPG
jgi:transcriptional regulator with XRE-family HTH domain